jgi:hypothetical protein
MRAMGDRLLLCHAAAAAVTSDLVLRLGYHRQGETSLELRERASAADS